MTDAHNSDTWSRWSDKIKQLDDLIDDCEWEGIDCRDLRDKRGRYVIAQEIDGDLIPPF